MQGLIRKLYNNFSFFNQITEEEIRFHMESIDQIEKSMIGRYCGSIEDKIFQTLICLDAAMRFPSEPKYYHMDIGVLFGGSLLSKLLVLDRHSCQHTVLGIDPFQGYYGESVDPISKLPVKMENVQNNIDMLGAITPSVELVQAFSYEKTVSEKLKGRALVTLMIDGDHSYEGVAADWNMYGPYVEPGGVVIFDDYSDESWPEVTRFVDNLLADGPTGWSLLGHVDTTLALRRDLL